MQITHLSKAVFQIARSQDNFGTSRSWSVSNHIPFTSWYHEIAGRKERYPLGVSSWLPLAKKQVVKRRGMLSEIPYHCWVL